MAPSCPVQIAIAAQGHTSLRKVPLGGLVKIMERSQRAPAA
jgi:hypothetical protein